MVIAPFQKRIAALFERWNQYLPGASRMLAHTGADVLARAPEECV